MNAKKSKAIRRFVLSLGHSLAKLPAPRTGSIAHKNPVTGENFVYDLPMTARYPAQSFQRVYSAAKRAFRRVPLAILNENANIHFAANSGRQVPAHR